jgi:phospholipid/cholesterol/gamma-HCH transport system ATP-binding protein
MTTTSNHNPNHEGKKEKNPVLEIKNLKIAFNGKAVLKDTSLTLNEGENLVVLGKSGTGKSVLIKCIVGLLRPDGGTIRIFDKDLLSLKKREFSDMRQKIGFLFQNGALYDSMTIKQNLEFPLVRLKKDLSKKDRESKIVTALENIGLPDVINKMPSELSGGQRKRVSLARTIIVDPLIMLYDEPTTGLDPVTSDEISQLINDIQKQLKTSSIIITHDLRCAQQTADRIMMLDEGVIHMEGTMEEFEKSEDPLVKAFFTANIS